jgi:hypothetical protein
LMAGVLFLLLFLLPTRFAVTMVLGEEDMRFLEKRNGFILYM